MPNAATVAAVLAEVDAAIADDERTECDAGGEGVLGEHPDGELLVDEIDEDGSTHAVAADSAKGWHVVVGRVFQAKTLRDARDDLAEFVAASRRHEPSATRVQRNQTQTGQTTSEWNVLQSELKVAREVGLHDKGRRAPLWSSLACAVAATVGACCATQTLSSNRRRAACLLSSPLSPSACFICRRYLRRCRRRYRRRCLLSSPTACA